MIVGPVWKDSPDFWEMLICKVFDFARRQVDDREDAQCFVGTAGNGAKSAPITRSRIALMLTGEARLERLALVAGALNRFTSVQTTG